MRYRCTTRFGILAAAGAVLLWGCRGPTDGGRGGPAADRCADVDCPQGQQCNPDTGQCEVQEPDLCAGVECPEGQQCDPGTGQCEEEGPEEEVAPVPAPAITFELIGVHDPASGDYDGNCTSTDCHGDRLNEVALDGVTPTAHAAMASQFGAGNERCTACHGSGSDFLASSSGGLRKQVDMAELDCAAAACHGIDAALAFYAQ